MTAKWRGWGCYVECECIPEIGFSGVEYDMNVTYLTGYVK